MPRPSAGLFLAVVLTAAVLLAEGIGGLLANSLALLADAGHVLTDIFALGMSWFALRQARRPADARRTFGYHRVGIITALLNAAALLPISAFLIYEAVARLSTPSAHRQRHHAGDRGDRTGRQPGHRADACTALGTATSTSRARSCMWPAMPWHREACWRAR